jgi:leader peptidase (prepilin peptidase)/N-methyltransferase
MESYWFEIALFYAGLVGLMVGSFFNVIIYRTPLEQSLSWPPSHCPYCDAPIRWYQNIPVFSWLALRGKCANCKGPISKIYPIIESLTAGVAVLVVYFMNLGHSEFQWLPTLTVLWLALTAIPVFVVDFRHYLIPDSCSVGGIVVGIGLSFFPGGLEWFESLYSALIAGSSLFVFGFIASKILKREAMGFGDVKLVAGFGALLGLSLTALSIVIGSFIGLLVTLPLKALKKEGAEVPLPFGPYLIIGAIISYLYGELMLDWYFKSVMGIGG